MVNSVSGTPTGGNVTSTTPLTKSDLSDPGSYSSDLNAGISQPERQKGSALGFLVKLVIGAAVTGGAMVAVRKFGLKGELASFDKTKLTGKIKYHFANITDKIIKCTEDAKNYVKGIFNEKKETPPKTEAPAAEEPELKPRGPKPKTKKGSKKTA